MSNKGFIKIPYSLLEDPVFLSYNQNFTSILMAIIFHTAYADCVQDDNGRRVHVKRGQLLASYEQIAKWAKVDKNSVQRAIKKFCDDQKAIRAPRRNKRSNGKQDKTLLTITIEGIYDEIKTTEKPSTATTTDTRPIRDRYVKQENKENKEDINKNNNNKEDESLVFAVDDAVVVAFPEIIENLDLTIDEKFSLEAHNFPEDRLKAAIEYATHPLTKINQNLISTLIWHCSKREIIMPNQPKNTPQQKLALKYNQILLENGHKNLHEKNTKTISQGFVYGSIDGVNTTISLNNSTEQLKKDFNDSIKSLLQGKIIKFLA